VTKAFDAIIVGAGVIGTSIGYQLARRGWRTLNIDQLSASGQGSTSSSLAIIRTHYSTREGCALAWEGYHCWANWSGYLNLNNGTDLAQFIQTGVIALKTKDNDRLTSQIALSKELKIPFEEWSPSKISEQFPAWDLSRFGPPVISDDPRFGHPSGPTVDGGVFFPKAGYCNDPRLATQNLQQATEAAGGMFRFQCAVEHVRTVGSRIAGITLSDNTQINAPVVVNAAGPHSEKINELAGIAGSTKITTRAVRHESVHLALPTDCNAKYDDVVTFDYDIGSYTRPDYTGSIFVGSQGTDFDQDQTVDPDDFDRNFTNKAHEPVYRLAQRIPTLGIPNQLRGIVDLWDVTEDWIPVYDCSDLPGYYLAIGTSGNQFKAAPVVGALMAELIGACETGHNHDLEPITFLLERTGNAIGLDFFSRNRNVNHRSSFSVLA
jgi:sarcosine oxidase subunit beta